MREKKEEKTHRLDVEGNGRGVAETERTDGEVGQQAFRIGLCDFQQSRED